MNYFHRFRKPRPPSSATSAKLPGTCWRIAYLILPHYAFNDCEKLVGLCLDESELAGAFFYFIACKAQKIEPLEQDALRFRVHHGRFDFAHDYYALEYPTPPPVDLFHVDPLKPSPEEKPVLAPYFSVIIRHRETKMVAYYALGQAPTGGGTTLRSVTQDGTNRNHGPGPEPRFDAFLARLRATGEELKTFGAWKS